MSRSYIELAFASVFVVASTALAGCTIPDQPEESTEATQSELTAVDVVGAATEDAGAELRSCVCIPHNCCCGPVGKPCKWRKSPVPIP